MQGRSQKTIGGWISESPTDFMHIFMHL